MTLDERKAEIKKLALEEKSNGALIYQLVDAGDLDFVISKINDKKTKTNSQHHALSSFQSECMCVCGNYSLINCSLH